MTFGQIKRRLFEEDQLFSALVELTYRCNLDCYFCYNDLSLKGRTLSLEDYKRLFDDLAELGVLNLVLTGGEPLSHPQFFEIGAHARANNFMVRIKSNGHALRGEIARRVLNEVDPYIIDTSLHGGIAATHDRQTRVPGSFDRLLANIAEWRELGLKVKINCTLTRWNQDEVEQIFAIADRFECQLQVDPEVTPRDDGDTSPLDISPTPEGVRGLFQYQARWSRERAMRAASAAPPPIIARQDSDLMKASPAASPSERKHCGAGSTGIAIDPFGDVFPCVQWRRSIGNLHESSIRDIWQNRAELDDIRETTRQAATLVDAEGEHGKFMSFCPGLAHSHSGDALQIYDSSRRRGKIVMEAFAQYHQSGEPQESRPEPDHFETSEPKAAESRRRLRVVGSS